MIDTTITATRRLPLAPAQIATLVALGITLWFGAALLLRALEPQRVFDGSARVLLYALVIPSTLPFVFLAQRLARLDRREIGLGMAIATAPALLLDGVAVAWFPALYGADPAHVTAAAAAILWGAGVGLVLGFLVNRA